MIGDLFCPIDTVVIGGKKKRERKKRKVFCGCEQSPELWRSA